MQLSPCHKINAVTGAFSPRRFMVTKKILSGANFLRVYGEKNVIKEAVISWLCVSRECYKWMRNNHVWILEHWICGHASDVRPPMKCMSSTANVPWAILEESLPKFIHFYKNRSTITAGSFKAARFDEGRSRHVRTPTMKEDVDQTFEDNPSMSIRAVAFQIGVSRKNACRALHDEKMHPFHLQRV